MLAIHTADEVESAIAAPANQIPGSIEALRNFGRPFEKTLAGELGTVQIATSEAVAPDVEFTDCQGRRETACAVQNIECPAGQRTPDRADLLPARERNEWTLAPTLASVGP